MSLFAFRISFSCLARFIINVQPHIRFIEKGNICSHEFILKSFRSYLRIRRDDHIKRAGNINHSFSDIVVGECTRKLLLRTFLRVMRIHFEQNEGIDGRRCIIL